MSGSTSTILGLREVRATAAVLCALAVSAAWRAAGAGEVHVDYAAVERALVAAVLTDGGRYYIEGGPTDACRYAFVQEPRVDADAGRLRVRFVFSGRAGVEVRGRCVGPGDTLDLVASGVPAVAAGELVLQDLTIDAPDSRYFRLVSGLVEAQLRDRLRYPLRRHLDEALAAPAATFRLALTGLSVGSIDVGPDGLRFDWSADLTVR